MSKLAAFGTKLLRGAVEVAQVQSISGPGLALDTEDVTSHDSPGGWEEVVGTILRSGEISLDIVYDPGELTHTSLISALESKTLSAFDLKFTDGTMWEFNAYVIGFEPTAPVEGALTASVTLKIDGEPILDSSYSI